jgi:peptide/nickel transport system substrate-binding protein
MTVNHIFLHAALALLLASGVAHAEAPQRGGTLNVALEIDVKSLDPIFGNAPGLDRKVYNLYTEDLVMEDNKGQFHPWLAESWDYAEDGKTVVFYLRRGVTFQDGTPFDAEAVKFNLDRLMNPTTGSPRRANVPEIAAVEVIDPSTVKVTLSRPLAAFLAYMANEQGSMVSPTAVKSLGKDFALKPVGTGPFILVTRGSNEIDAVRWDHYWQMGADGKPLPYLDRIHMTINPNSAVRLINLRSGAAQLGDPILPKDFEQVQRTSGLALRDSGTGASHEIHFNIRRPPFDNTDLRRAASLAINREALVKIVSKGTGVVLTGVEPPDSPVFDSSLRGHGYDPKLAHELFVKSSLNHPVTLTYIERDPDTQIAQIVQSMWKQIGMDVRLESLERLAADQKVLSGNFDLYLNRSALIHADPEQDLLAMYGRGGGANYSGLRSDEIYRLMDALHSEMDLAKRKGEFVRVQQMVNDGYFDSSLIRTPTKEVVSNRLHGLRRDGTGIWLYQAMWLDH